MTQPIPDSSQPPLILATDLGRAFTAGRPADAYRLTRVLEARPHSQVIYATERPLESAVAFHHVMHLPQPDVIVADNGAEVISRERHPDLDALNAELDDRWPGVEAVRSRLRDLRLVLQERPVASDRHLVFFLTLEDDRAAIMRRMSERLEDLNVTVTYSAIADIEILPAHAGKGATLLQTLNRLQVDPGWVILGGDLLNDLTLLASGLRGFVLPHADRTVKKLAAERDGLYVTEHDGPNGVLEALEHFGYVN